MNNIEKQAERFGMEEDDGFAVMNADKRDGFKAGAEWAHQELTRWNDPDALPPAYHTVLLRIDNDDGDSDEYSVGYYSGECWYGGNLGVFDRVTGWREIHEYRA